MPGKRTPTSDIFCRIQDATGARFLISWVMNSIVIVASVGCGAYCQCCCGCGTVAAAVAVMEPVLLPIRDVIRGCPHAPPVRRHAMYLLDKSSLQ